MNDAEQAKLETKLSLLALFSILLLLFPYFGLPLAIIALYKISKSQGRLYGKTLAWISLVLNSLGLSLIIVGVVITLLNGGATYQSSIQTSPFGEIPIAGPQIWSIDEIDYRIDGTCVVILPKESNKVGTLVINDKVTTTSQQNDLMYVVKVVVDFDVKGGGHADLAKQIAEYAYNRGFYDEANKISRGGQRVELCEDIGIALVQQTSSKGGLMTHNSGYRYKISLSEIINEKETTASSASVKAEDSQFKATGE